VKSQEALAKVLRGVAKFQKEAFPQRRAIFERLRSQQQPIAMFFTCADSRVIPTLLLQNEPGEIFIERTPGNIVPKYTDQIAGVTASMEYAAQALRVPVIIVCGHSDCGVMKAVLHPETASGMPALQSWMRNSLPARERLLRDNPGATEEQKLRLVTEYNVLTQIENLKTHPSVEARLAKGDLEVHGWVYDIASGTVSAADPVSGKFETLELQA
jgi:carbonic anhydrase